MADRNQKRHPYWRNPDEQYEDDQFFSNRAWNRGDYVQGRPYGRDWSRSGGWDKNQNNRPSNNRNARSTSERNWQDYNWYRANRDYDWEDEGWAYGNDYLTGATDYGGYPRVYSRRDYRGNYGDYYYGDRNDYENETDIERDYGSDETYDFNRGFGRGYGRGMDTESYRDYGSDRQRNNNRHEYPTAGMQSDYGDNQRGWEPNRGFGQNYYGSDRYGRGQNTGYGYGDFVGYEDQGAFYQDLDNPYSYDYWDVDVNEDIQDFTGVGPTGYQRTDERIMDDVCDRLSEHGWIDASDIDVTVKDGEVTLRGTVRDRRTKRLAEDVADDVFGVTDVNNELRVRSQQREPSRRDQKQHRDRHGYEENRSQERQIANTGSNVSEPTTGFTVSEPTTASMINEIDANQRRNVHVGMQVIGRDGEVIGQIKEIRENDFLVDRELARDVYVPFNSIQAVGEQVMLSIASIEVDSQNWNKPPVI